MENLNNLNYQLVIRNKEYLVKPFEEKQKIILLDEDVNYNINYERISVGNKTRYTKFNTAIDKNAKKVLDKRDLFAYNNRAKTKKVWYPPTSPDGTSVVRGQ